MVKTGLGISDGSYKQNPREPGMDWEVQGTTDTPSIFTMQTDVVMKAHKLIPDCLNIDSCDMKRSINHHNIAYADDNDGHATAEESNHQDQAAHEAVSRLQSSAQHWSNLTSLTGGSIALHKCNWQLIAWEFFNGELSLVKVTKEQLLLEDRKELHSII